MSSADRAPRDWDGATYDKVANPHVAWGTNVLGRLDLRGDETVLDAGCGSGRVTELLLHRLPQGHVIGLDASPSMLAEARKRLEKFGDRLEFICADVTKPLPLDEPVDAILSTAVFHWIGDHDALFRSLAGALKPGGQLVIQCGGAGNIDSVLRAVAEVLAASAAVTASHAPNAPEVGPVQPPDIRPFEALAGWPGPWNFATPEETSRRLEAAGFTQIQTWLNPEPTPLEPGEPLETFLGTVILGSHLERLPEAERESFVKAVADRLPNPEIDYVRLNIVARRA
jgi:trans-aconitate 2-methyltransferase